MCAVRAGKPVVDCSRACGRVCPWTHIHALTQHLRLLWMVVEAYVYAHVICAADSRQCMMCSGEHCTSTEGQSPNNAV